MELANTPLFFWIFAGGLTIAAVAAALWPLMRGDGRSDPPDVSENEGTRQVLIAQLEEIGRDRDRGLLNEEEETGARAEVARRLLALDRENLPASSLRSSSGQRERSHAVYPWAMIVLIPLASVGFYSLSGVPGLPDRPILARFDEEQVRLAGEEEPDAGLAERQKEADKLVTQVEAHLAKNPDDGRGWQVIAPVYLSRGELGKAENAFRRALAIGSEDKSVIGSLQNGLGQVLAVQNEGLVNEEALGLFQEAQKNDPNDPTGFFFAALALSQANRRNEAIFAWEEVIARFAKDNPPWLEMAQRTLAVLQSEAAVERKPDAENPDTGRNPPSAPRGPSTEQAEAAAGLSAQERGALIENMVAGLAARLEENPQDLTGWRQLIRSYMVLGRTSEARGALQKARATFGNDAEARAALDATAAEHNL